jgi:hypothetical protein
MREWENRMPPDAEALLKRLDGIVEDLSKDFDGGRLGRAFLVEGMELLQKTSEHYARWCAERAADLAAGQWTRETCSEFITEYRRS